MAGALPDLVLLTLGALALYAVLVWQSSKYSQRTQWQPPPGNETMNWDLRRNLALTLGSIAVLICAVSSVLFVSEWSHRLLITGQAVVMAASGASDLRRFHLPLPLTVLGVALALLMIGTQQLLMVFVLFGIAWAGVVILLHALLSKGSMQLGDHLATLWIALASPFNGLLAIVAGDLSNVILAKVKGLRGKKVAAAGAWLIFSSALMGLPPYVLWFRETAQNSTHTRITQVSDMKGNETRFETVRTLLMLAQWASDHTAQVAFAEGREARIAAARSASEHVARIAVITRYVLPENELAPVMDDLASALALYDVVKVQSASIRLETLRQKLTHAVDIAQLMNQE